MIKPQIHYSTEQSYRDWQNDYSRKKSKTLYAYFKTYRQLVKEIESYLLQAYCPEDEDTTVFVVRSRRGEWGEWCETWEMINGVPTIIKSGWS